MREGEEREEKTESEQKGQSKQEAESKEKIERKQKEENNSFVNQRNKEILKENTSFSCTAKYNNLNYSIRTLKESFLKTGRLDSEYYQVKYEK